MGNDGGTKALQRKYTRWGTKKEVSHYETDEEIQGKWSCCALTGEALQEPVGPTSPLLELRLDLCLQTWLYFQQGDNHPGNH